jgi:hypothetical protein
MTPRRTETRVKARTPKSAWVIGVAAIFAVAGIACLLLFVGRGAPKSPTVEFGTARDEHQAPEDHKLHDESAAPLAASDARAPVHEAAAAAVAPAWSFVVVDRAGQAIAEAELVRGEHVIARSNANGGMAIDADALDLEHAPRDLAWSVRHPGHRTASIDASRIGRVDRVVLDDAWPVHVHVQDGAGAAIANAQCVLYVHGARQYDEIARGTSDATGNVAFEDIAVASAILATRAKGFEYNGRSLSASNAADRDVVVVLRNGVDLEVRVASSSGARISGAHLIAHYTGEAAETASGPASWDRTTNGEGVAVLESLPRVNHAMQLSVDAAGYTRHVETLAMTDDRVRSGLDVVLAAVGRLRVHVHESDGAPREASITSFAGTFEISRSPVPTARTAPGQYELDVVAGIALNVFAWIDGAPSGSASDVIVQEGESRDVDIVVPHHVALDVRAIGLDGVCGKADKVTLAAVDGRMSVAYGPAGLPGNPLTLSYQSTFDEHCRAQLWVQPGSYRAAWIHDGRALVIRTVEIPSAQVLELAVEAERSVSGILRDASKVPLAGWTVAAHERGGRASYSAKTTADGRFTIDAVMPKQVELFAVVPEHELWVSVAESVAPPASKLELTLELARVSLHTVNRDDGANVSTRYWVSSLKGSMSSRSEHSTDDAGLAELELPIGQWMISAATGAHGRSGSTLVSINKSAAVSLTLYLRKLEMRTFKLSGAPNSGALLWTALEGPDAAEGQIPIESIRNGATVECDLPDGRVRFEIMNDDALVGSPIEVVVHGSDPIVLAW